MVVLELEYRPKPGCVFQIRYETDWLVALNTFEHFTRASVQNNFLRQDNYHADTIRLVNPNHRATNAMYNGQAWQRGLLISCDNWSGWAATMNCTFVMTNIVPQEGDMNMHVWILIEIFGRKLLGRFTSVYANTGTIFDGPVQMMNGIRVPSHLYKVYLTKDFGVNQWNMWSFRVPNIAGQARNAVNHYVDINVLQNQTGLNFNPTNLNIVNFNV